MESVPHSLGIFMKILWRFLMLKWHRAIFINPSGPKGLKRFPLHLFHFSHYTLSTFHTLSQVSLITSFKDREKGWKRLEKNSKPFQHYGPLGNFGEFLVKFQGIFMNFQELFVCHFNMRNIHVMSIKVFNLNPSDWLNYPCCSRECVGLCQQHIMFV